jgi:pimeloyl-ACP methyl ester carboxylesterase
MVCWSATGQWSPTAATAIVAVVYLPSFAKAERLAVSVGANAMAETPETHYVRSDDVHIAYQVLGDGPFDLLFVPGFVSNVEALWRSPDQSAFFRRLASFCRLILFDKRGTGMSDRGTHDFTLEQRMHDVQAILDAIGCKQAALFGVSEGGPMSLLYAATYPHRTSTAPTPSGHGLRTTHSVGAISNGNVYLRT